jgi:repressor LexA
VVDLKLTKRQQEIFEFIKQYSGRHGYPPTVRDIGKAIGLTSSSTVHAHLANLEKLGLVRRDPTKPRALELLGEAARKIAWRRRTSRTTSKCRRSRVATKVSTSSGSRATR